jgi:pilus assembly protein Flp/PilA
MIGYMQMRVVILRGREDGQAMVEYALILGLVSVVSVALLTTIGTDLTGLFTSVETLLAGAV